MTLSYAVSLIQRGSYRWYIASSLLETSNPRDLTTRCRDLIPPEDGINKLRSQGVTLPNAIFSDNIGNIQSKRSHQKCSKVKGFASSWDLNAISTISTGILKIFRENLDLIVIFFVQFIVIWLSFELKLKGISSTALGGRFLQQVLLCLSSLD